MAKDYMIEKRGDKYVLISKEDGSVLGTHDTMDEAQAQEAAIKAKQANLAELHAIHGIEIFASGKWNGDDYSESDLELLISSAKDVGFTAPLKAGHSEDKGTAALGWVSNLRRSGEKLLADFVDLPKAVYEAIKNRKYDRVSSEIYWDLQRNGKTFPRVLKAVALLGADIPAVDLNPLRTIVNESGKSNKVALCDHKEDEDMDKVEELQAQIKALQAQVKELEVKLAEAKVQTSKTEESSVKIKELEASLETERVKVAAISEDRRKEKIEKKLSYLKIPAFRPHFKALFDVATGVKVVKFSTDGKSDKDVQPEEVVDQLMAEINKSADKIFGEISHGGRTREEGWSGDNASQEVDRKTKEYMAERKMEAKDYEIAMKAVLDADPALKAVYASV